MTVHDLYQGATSALRNQSSHHLHSGILCLCFFTADRFAISALDQPVGGKQSVVCCHDILTIVVEDDVLLQNGPGMLVHNEAKLLYGHLLGVSLIRLEQVVIQIFRNLDSGSNIVTIRRKDNCLEFGKFS